MAQMEVYDVLKNRYLKGNKDYVPLLIISDNIIEGIKKEKYCGSYDVSVLECDCRRLCVLGLLQKKKRGNSTVYRLNGKTLEDA